MKKLIAIGLVPFVVWAPTAGAEVPAGPVAPNSETVTTPNSTSLYNSASPFRLFDPTRLTLRQSYSVSYFSGGAGSGSVGLYMNSIGYQISRPLYVQLDLGIMHNPGALWGAQGAVSGAHIRPNLFMRYAPSPGFQLILDVRTLPIYYGAYGFAGPRLR